MEKFEDLDQAPDFFIPNASEPAVVIEAKYADDDGTARHGTARDKVTRIAHLRELSDERERAKPGTGFRVVAVVEGRGFGIRDSDIRKTLIACGGKVFSLYIFLNIWYPQQSSRTLHGHRAELIGLNSR